MLRYVKNVQGRPAHARLQRVIASQADVGCQQRWHLSVSRISYGEIVTIRVPYHLLLLSNDFERPSRVVTLQFPQVRFLSSRCGFLTPGGFLVENNLIVVFY